MGWLRAPLRSPLVVFLKAWLIVSIVNSPALGNIRLEVGLPNAFEARVGEVSVPLIDAALLVGGEVPRPCEDTGDLRGDGERCPDEKEVIPAI